MHSDALMDRRVAILEDDPTNRDRLSSLISMSGGVPMAVDPPAPMLAKLETYLANLNISMLVCDHRLFERNYASYTGAAAVATSYKNGRGGVLVTAWEKEDAETTIREHRRWIPALVHARELKRRDLEAALLQADREVRERILVRGRVPHRTIMTIRRLVKMGTQQLVKVVMSQWNPRDEVGFPLDLIPKRIRAKVVPGRMLIAQVNIEAERSEDLFFDRFELPDPDVLRECQTLFGGA